MIKPRKVYGSTVVGLPKSGANNQTDWAVSRLTVRQRAPLAPSTSPPSLRTGSISLASLVSHVYMSRKKPHCSIFSFASSHQYH